MSKIEQNPNAKKLSYAILGLILGIIFFLFGFLIGRSDLQSNKVGGENTLGGKDVDLGAIWEVWDKIDATYIEKDVDEEKYVDGMIKGLVDTLEDPYTSYLSPEETRKYLQENAGQFEGIGTTLRYTGEYTEIESPIDGYGAQKAGLRPGDAILEVDGNDVIGKRAFEVATLIRGKAGTEVALKVARRGEAKPLEFKITRAAIDLDSVSQKKLDDKTAYIKITQFTEDDLSSFKKQWDLSVKEVESYNTDVIIVDLRNNPGGYVDGVVYVVNEFLPKDKVVIMEEDRNGDREEKKTTRDGKFKDKKVIILVNEGSASASEIMAGSLQEHKRATVIGMPTVGKGVEQRIVGLESGGSLHIVFQKWLLPSGRQITKENPITPDIKVEMSNDDFVNRRDPQLDRASQEAKK